MIDCSRRPDTRCDDSDGVRTAKIIKQSVVMGFDRFGLFGIRIGISHQQNSFFRDMDLSVNGKLFDRLSLPQ